MVTFGDAPPQAGAVEGGRGELPGSDRLGVPSPQVTDDPELVGAPAGGGSVPVPAGGQEGLREVIVGPFDPPAHKAVGPPRIEGVRLNRRLVRLAAQSQRQAE